MAAPPTNASKPTRGPNLSLVGAMRTHRIAPTVRYVILAAAGLCLMLTGCSVSITGRPVAAPDLGHWQPPVPDPRLGNLLLSAGDVNAVGGTTTMALRASISEMSHNEGLVDDRNCLDAYSPIEASVYRGSSWVALQGQLLDNAHSRDPRKHALLQAVVGFRDADSAQQFFSEAKPRWSACTNRPLTTTQPGDDPVTWTLGELVTTDTTLTITQTLDGGAGFACQRATGVRNNVIIDTLWCGYDTTNQAGEVVAKIAAAV
jgi:PknH-like extracellular domain